MALKRTTAPTDEPVTLDDAKLSLRVDGTDEDDLIEMLIGVARADCEARIGCTLPLSGWTLTLDGFPPANECILLPMPPLESVTSIVYVDENGASQTLSTSQYVVDASGLVGRVGLALGVSNWPVTADRISAVTVAFTAGYQVDHGHGPPINDVPKPLRQWVLLAVGDLYANRERSAQRPNIPQGFADGLLDTYRQMEV